jgi:hypothetical protein
MIPDIIARMRHDGCGGRAGKVNCSPASRAPAVGRGGIVLVGGAVIRLCRA